MGMQHSTYFAFGAKIAQDAYAVDWEELEPGGIWHPTLMAYDVGFLMAGDYDRDMMFLTSYCKRVEPGWYERINAFEINIQVLGCQHNLRSVAAEIGHPLIEEPSWFVVPDLS